MSKDKSVRTEKLKNVLKEKTKSLLGPVLILLLIVIGILIIAFWKEEETPEEIVKVNTYEGNSSDIVLENENLKMVMDPETTQFTVTKKSTGAIWYSNPQDADEDTVALKSDIENLKSTLLLTYSVVNGVDTLYYNYKYSISSKIFNIEATENSIKVDYSIGEVEKEYIIPLVAEEERMEELLGNMSKGVENMSEKILIIDDEQDIADLLEVYLKYDNYIVYKFYCATDAMSCIESGDIDLAILDIMLPDMNGFSLCQLIRKKYTYPIIMLTAKIEETDKITGLTLGADDYVTKPFRPLEVVARVKAQLRRYKKYSPGIITEKVPSELSYNKLCLNVQTHECLLDGEPVSLTPTEFSILHVLLLSAGNVVSIEELFHAVWKDEYYSKNSSTITVHIRHLREKLNDTSDTPQYIKTIWGVGYKI